ncbi:MAG: InlB B-repeat-containing protein [Clostridia bacterium]|nr:InlB B-repeat-containing protein [Clostridia bacterium]
MKKFVSIVSVLLCLCLLCPALAVTAANISVNTESKAKIELPLTSSKYSYNGYTTWTMKEAKLVSLHANQTVGGTNCTSMQGMNVGTTYIYTAKRNSDDTYVSIARTNANTGAVSYMNYYSSTSATSTSACNSCGHANDLLVVTADSVNYMFVATGKSGKALTRLKISGTNLYFTGYFDLVNTNGTSMSASSVRQYKHSGGYFYLLIKNGETFYYCKIADTATGGSSASPTKITCYKIFTIDKRNAIFAKSSSSAGTYANMETWVNQGFFYNSNEKTIYVPMFKPNSPINTNVIITFYVGDVLTDARMDFSTNKTTLVHPTKTNFYLTAADTGCNDLEIESVGFRTGQGTTGDLKMYINANASPVASYEGVYSLSYTSGSGDFTPIVDENSVVYTVKYNANGGTDSGTNSSSGNYKMSQTIHIRGVSNKLRPNYFTRSGYSFAGWYLTRQSDSKWLYFNADGSTNWYIKGSQPAGAKLALYEDMRTVSSLTTVDGDVVTCYAQWTPNSTGTKSYYIQYDANGGTGTMADTKIVYGTSTKISTNTFTREGYTFVGWIAFRRSDNSWCYKDNSTLGDKWIASGNDTTGYFLKTYTDGCSISASTSVDRDIVTFYAAWAKVNGALPTELIEGTPFTLGNVVSHAGMYGVTATVNNSEGNAVATHTANPYTTSYALSAAKDIKFEALATGTYTLKVQIQTVNGSSPKAHTILNTTFNVISPAKLELKDSAVSEGYILGDEYFTGFSVGNTAADLKLLFKYDISITNAEGAAVADTAVIGTGWVINCNGESRTTVLYCDINGDAAISTTDYAILRKHIADGNELSKLMRKAADPSLDLAVNTTDLVILRKELGA